jgi:3-hydroxymyristoyl/3-hydroxydecanoyl-(acyl carrier protein) dehydratase
VSARATFDEVTVDVNRAHGRVHPAHATALCAGHFPGDPVVPGAYLLGLMAELAARLMHDARLHRIVRSAFRRPVAPTGEIHVRAERAPRGRVEAEVYVHGTCAARATLVFGTPA